MEIIIKHYVFRDKKTMQFIGVDEHSGGYPFKLNTLCGSEIWTSTEKAREYEKVIFWNKPSEWELYEIDISNNPVKGE
jgi:hypothetical protein